MNVRGVQRKDDRPAFTRRVPVRFHGGLRALGFPVPIIVSPTARWAGYR